MLKSPALKSIPAADVPGATELTNDMYELPLEVDIGGIRYKLNVPEFSSSIFLVHEDKVIVPTSVLFGDGLSYEPEIKTETTIKLPTVFTEINEDEFNFGLTDNTTFDKETYNSLIEDLTEDFLKYLSVRSSAFLDLVEHNKKIPVDALIKAKYDLLDEEERNYLSSRLLELLYYAPDKAKNSLTNLANVVKRSLVFTENIGGTTIVDMMTFRLYMVLLNRLHPSRILFDHIFDGFSKQFFSFLDDMVAISIVVSENDSDVVINDAEKALEFVKKAFFLSEKDGYVYLTTNYSFTFKQAKIKNLSTGVELVIDKSVTVNPLETLPCKIIKSAPGGSLTAASVPKEAVLTPFMVSGAVATYFTIGRLYSEDSSSFKNLNVRIVAHERALGLQASSPTTFAKIVLNDKFDGESETIIEYPYKTTNIGNAKEDLLRLMSSSDTSYKKSLAALYRASILLDKTFLEVLEIHKMFPPIYREIVYTYITKISRGREVIVPFGYLSGAVLLQIFKSQGKNLEVPGINAQAVSVKQHENLIKKVALNESFEEEGNYIKNILGKIGFEYKAFQADIQGDLDLNELKIRYGENDAITSVGLRGTKDSIFGFVSVQYANVATILPVYLYVTDSVPASNIWMKDLEEWKELVPNDSGILLPTLEIPITKNGEKLNLGDAFEAVSLMKNPDALEYLKLKNSKYVQNGRILEADSGKLFQIIRDYSIGGDRG